MVKKVLFAFTLSLLAVSPAGLAAESLPTPPSLNEAEYPLSRSVVKILRRGLGDKTCSGILINSSTVLAAASCHIQKSDKVAFYDHRRFKVSRYDIESVTAHPHFGFSRYKASDIAVIRLKVAIEGYTAPFEVSRDALQVGPLSHILVAGYPHRKGGTIEFRYLPVAEVNYSSQEFSLSQNEEDGACYGDSGGPAFALNEEKVMLVGIFSHFDTKDGVSDNCGANSVYTKINAFSDFIEEFSGEDEFSEPFIDLEELSL